MKLIMKGDQYIESYGMYYEELKVGMIVNHRPGRTITESDNTWITLLTMNSHPIHFDRIYASNSEFKKVLVNSALTFSIVNGMTVNSMSAKAIANLGWNNVRMSAPVFVGDTLYAKSTVLEKRLSRSREKQGIVTIETEAFNQDEVTVMVCERRFLVPTEK